MEGQRRAGLRVKMPGLAQYEIQRGAGVLSQSCDDPTDAAAWVIRAGLAGVPELDLLRGFCERAAAMGLPIARAQVLVDTLHPIHEGRVFRWQADRVGEVVEYGRTRLWCAIRVVGAERVVGRAFRRCAVTPASRAGSSG